MNATLNCQSWLIQGNDFISATCQVIYIVLSFMNTTVHKDKLFILVGPASIQSEVPKTIILTYIVADIMIN